MTTTRDPKLVAAGKRLEAVRVFLYPWMRQYQFAEAFGVNPKTYNNWEKGKAPIDEGFIERFAALHPGYDYAWFRRGQPRDLPNDFREFLSKRGGLTLEA